MASIIYHGPGKALLLMYHNGINHVSRSCPGKSLSLMYHSPGKIFVVDVSMYHHGINQQRLRAALAPVHFYLRRIQEHIIIRW